MKISIITVCYNSEKTIQDTLSSIEAQTYENIEYLVVDGGSTDSTLQILENNRRIISKYISEPDNGLYDARNKGLSMASGDVIGFINSDDMLDQATCISEIAKVFENSGAEIVYGDKLYVNPENTEKIERYWQAGAFDIKAYKSGWMTPHLSTYIKKSVYEKFGRFNTDFKIAADYELMLRFIVKNKIRPVYLPMVIARMRSGGISNSSILNILRSNVEVYRSWKINSLHISISIIFIKPLMKLVQFFRKKS